MIEFPILRPGNEKYFATGWNMKTSNLTSPIDGRVSERHFYVESN